MGELLERSDLNALVFGAGVFENYKNNSLYFYQKFKESDNHVRNLDPKNIQLGEFYFLHYMDDSNWMKYSPIFTVDFKAFADKLLVFGVNLNFLPIEIRIAMFDKFMNKDNFEKDVALKVNFEGVYKELRSFGFEYAIVEYNVAQIVLAHRINMEKVPRFLYSGHPKNKYDPKKLYGIWNSKLDNRKLRDAEMSKLTVDQFNEMNEEISGKMTLLKNHIERVKRSMTKYG